MATNFYCFSSLNLNSVLSPKSRQSELYGIDCSVGLIALLVHTEICIPIVFDLLIHNRWNLRLQQNFETSIFSYQLMSLALPFPLLVPTFLYPKECANILQAFISFGSKKRLYQRNKQA